ncbi:DUF4126 domain-containing protein [Pseudoclavibacter chungangensis]|uniref:DUF4126 domain-containing protein n=1 Tax=Pseudoclavibacter chungangensis TaxID=587635 RepID=A0A7J5BVC0_9MICO|nr:DUF4126 domain-containing protein [Pseudoclavibacter chungangensis]KAB1657802.1 DUF4126 domain-containing protein [Pseudoclavibacter chungangensis]NYJ66608.1 hypothetical protein [Pseudoclavibacter chungangensis]
MLEILTGAGLATASGLNAFIPMLAMGLLARFTSLVTLPAGWEWLSNEWVMVIIGVLLVLDVVADKVPAVDHVNDIIQTVVRPAAGGIVFGAGASSQTAAVTDPASFFTSNAWVPVAIGVVVALATHLLKAGTRAGANVVTAGAAAPALSVTEDAMSVGLTFAAIIVPVLVIVFLLVLGLLFWVLFRRMRRIRDARRARASGSEPPVPPLPPAPAAS